MTQLTGTATLARFIARRDRLRILVWIASIALLEILTAISIKGVYPTQKDIDAAAASTRDNAASIALNGPDQGLHTLGGQVAFQIGTVGLVAVGLMSIFMVGRETRAEEESGRLEMIRSMAVGRHATTAACLIVVGLMNIAVAASVTFGLIGMNLPAAGSITFGVSLCALGFVFAGITLVAAQVSENTRIVYGSASTVLGAAFVLRAIGDIGDGTLSWLSPIGWSQKMRPFAGDQWWPLIIAVVFGAGLVVAASALLNHRDEGAGLVRPRPGPRSASPGMGRSLGLALRLQRGSLIGWSVAVALTGASFGWIANDVEDLVGDNETMRKVIAQTGGVSLTDSFLSSMLLLTALLATGFAIQSAFRLRNEETGLRAEPVLATPVSRSRWAAGHLAVALAGSVIVLAAGGLGVGLTYGVVGGDLGQVPRLLGCALAYVPALWLFVGLTVALFGLVPRGVSAAWAVLAGCVVVGLLGEALNIPSWFTDASPFHHTPSLPAADLTVVPLVVLAGIAGAMVLAGLTAFRRRDLG